MLLFLLFPAALSGRGSGAGRAQRLRLRLVQRRTEGDARLDAPQERNPRRRQPPQRHRRQSVSAPARPPATLVVRRSTCVTQDDGLNALRSKVLRSGQIGL